MDEATRRLLEAGRLSQRCPKCGTTEAAGFYCTRCTSPTGPDDWYSKPTAAHRRKAQ